MTTPLPRGQFPVTARWRYFNHASVAPMPLAAVGAMARAAEATAADGAMDYEPRAAEVERVRTAAAGLLGVGRDDVAFVKNTTEGMALVAAGLDWRPGDRVVVPDHEFPTVLYPWLALADRGVEVTLVPTQGTARALPIDAFEAALAAGPPPRVVATSWVQYARGWRIDLAALAERCHDVGALLVVDLIQGLGAIPAALDEWGVDVGVAGGHKWLLGPEGIGVVQVAERCRDAIRPMAPGWASVRQRGEYDDPSYRLDASARRYEGGTVGVAAIHALGASIDLLLDAGIEAVAAHIDRLGDRAVAALAAQDIATLSDRSAEGRSGIVTVASGSTEPDRVAAVLADAGVAVAARGGGIRLSPHGYNTDDEVDEVVEALVAAIAGPRGRPEHR